MPAPATSSAVLTREAKGTEALAILNGTISTILSFLVSPLLINLLGSPSLSLASPSSSSVADDLDFWDSLQSLFFTLLLPMILAFGAKSIFRIDQGRSNSTAVKSTFLKMLTSRSASTVLQNTILLLLVWNVFCDTFKKHTLILSPLQLQALIIAIGIVSLAFYFLLTIGLFFMLSASKIFSPPDSVSIIFTAGQKSLSSGLPLIQAIVKARSQKMTTRFNYRPHGGNMRDVHASSLMILPLIVYHTVQLIVGGMFVHSFRKWIASTMSEEAGNSVLPQRSPQSRNAMDKSKENIDYIQPSFDSKSISSTKLN